jgi:phosphate acyltransferase
MKIALDVMGGDLAPQAPVLGAVESLRYLSADDRVILIGQEDVIRRCLRDHHVDEDVFEIVNTTEVIGTDEHPTSAFSKKRNASIPIGYQLMKQGRVQAFASAGNTGAMLVGAMYMLNTIPGIIRPCIPALIPRSDEGYNLVLDVGSNPDARPDVLYQYAMIGSVYARLVLGIEQPRVALLNIGEEEDKGNLLSQAAYKAMKGSGDFRFTGNIESRDLFGNSADVIVCDGFSGNIVLKQIEGFYNLLMTKGIDHPFFSRYNYENYGGTPILGVNGVAMIAHGISSPSAIGTMLTEAAKIYTSGLVDELQATLKRFSE